MRYICWHSGDLSVVGILATKFRIQSAFVVVLVFRSQAAWPVLCVIDRHKQFALRPTATHLAVASKPIHGRLNSATPTTVREDDVISSTFMALNYPTCTY